MRGLGFRESGSFKKLRWLETTVIGVEIAKFLVTSFSKQQYPSSSLEINPSTDLQLHRKGLSSYKRR
jgi:hypothetical protein